MGQNTDMPIQGGKETRPFEMGPQHEGEELGAEHASARGHGSAYRGRGYRRSVSYKNKSSCSKTQSKFMESKSRFISITVNNQDKCTKSFLISPIQCNLPIAGRLRWFLKNWQKITGDHFILQIVQGYKLEFYTLPLQRQLPQYPMFNREQKDYLNQEIQKLLEKGAIQPVHQEQTQFLSCMFLVPKKDGGNRPVINLKKLNDFITYEHFKMEDSQEMLFTLAQENAVKINQECHQILNLQWVTVRKLAKITGKLVSTMQAIIPANLQCRYLQLLQIKSLVEGKSYETKIQLSKGAQEELGWWINQIDQSNGRAIISATPDMVITTDASNKGWGAVCGNISTGGQWGLQELEFHINLKELLAALLGLKVFTKSAKCLAVHMRVDNTTAVAYINKMGAQNPAP
ncbi:unnamed protein product [Mytilus coruscus]|uniref:RNase H type-1 domain-containing protein n=1 Tax=Mytilus coruscus TaxID=42192 RepID=A0A6J8DZD7_MYTCO|nr:unnamed protein product [Mytilus coruscus]